MKKLISWLLCIVMVLSMAACGKEPAKESENTAAPTTAPETEEVYKTDKNAKPEDVIRAAFEELTKESTKCAFTSDSVLDFTLTYKEQEGAAAASDDFTQMVIQMVLGIVFAESDELNLRASAKLNGFSDAAKGMKAEIEIENNIAEALSGILAALDLIPEDETSSPLFAETLKSAVYFDKEDGKVYFQNPENSEWNYIAGNAGEGTVFEIPEDIKLDDFLEKGYDWTITKDQYLLSGKVDLKGIIMKSLEENGLDAEEKKAAEEQIDGILDGIEVKIALQCNDEKKLESAELSIDTFTKDLSGLVPGLGIRLNQFSVKGKYDYTAKEEIAVPEDVRKNAEELDLNGLIPFGPGEDDYSVNQPWTGDKYSVADEILADDDSIRLTAKEIRDEEIFGDIEILFTLENKSEKNLTVYMDNPYINGLLFSDVVYEDVKAGESLDFTVTIDAYDMEGNGQEHAYTADLFFEISDADDYWADPLLYHFAMTLQNGEPAPIESDESMALLNDDGLSVSFLKMEQDRGRSPYLYFFYQNGKDIPVSFEFTTLSVNGAEFMTFGDTEIQAGFAGINYESASAEFMEENKIDEVTSVEGIIRAYSLDENWDETVYAENEFTITFANGTAVVSTKPVEQ